MGPWKASSAKTTLALTIWLRLTRALQLQLSPFTYGYLSRSWLLPTHLSTIVIGIQALPFDGLVLVLGDLLGEQVVELPVVDAAVAPPLSLHVLAADEVGHRDGVLVLLSN